MLIHVDCPHCDEEVDVRVSMPDDSDDAECINCGCQFSVSVSIDIEVSDIEYPSFADDEDDIEDDYEDSYERSRDPNQLALDL